MLEMDVLTARTKPDVTSYAITYQISVQTYKHWHCRLYTVSVHKTYWLQRLIEVGINELKFYILSVLILRRPTILCVKTEYSC